MYNPARVMEECLAIKPDLIFLWDEAWFGFARFNAFHRRRTAMGAAAALTARFRDPAYRAEYAGVRGQPVRSMPATRRCSTTPLLPDPDKVRIRVYQTCSTHKSMSALRQGSMILVWDDDFHHVEGVVPGSVLHAHVDLAEPADHRVARRRAPADGARRLRADDARGRDRVPASGGRSTVTR